MGDEAQTPEEREAAALAVIEAGIKDANESAGVETKAPDPADDAGGTGDAAGDDGAAAGGEDGGKGEGKGEGDDGSAAGKPAAKPTATEAAEAGEGGAGDKGKPEGDPGSKPKPEEDPLYKPLEGEVTDQTKDRFTKLVDRAKSVTGERDEAREQISTIFDALEDAGIRPDALPAFLEFSKGINTSDPALKRKAFERAQEFVAKLADELGETVPGKDPLEGHDDLKTELQEGAITKARAEEIAKGRNRAKAQARQSEQSKKLTAHQLEVEDGKAALTELGKKLDKEDAFYRDKYPELKRGLKAIFRDVHPSKWVERAEAYYRDIPDPEPGRKRPSVGDRVPAGEGNRNSERPRQPAGGSEAKPGSHLEAIEAGIKAAR